jgi:hypothetical protein
MGRTHPASLNRIRDFGGQFTQPKDATFQSTQSSYLCILLRRYKIAAGAATHAAHGYIAQHAEGIPISLIQSIEWEAIFWLPYFLLVPAALILVDRYRLSVQKKSSLVIYSIVGLIFTYIHIAVSALSWMPWKPLPNYWGRFYPLFSRTIDCATFRSRCSKASANCSSSAALIPSSRPRTRQFETVRSTSASILTAASLSSLK